MTEELKRTLFSLAKKYETPSFLRGDPSCFLRQFKEKKDQEIVAFIASSLAFGKREQILSHVQTILENAAPSPTRWILEGNAEAFFPKNDRSFYRIFSNNSMRIFFSALKKILLEEESLGEFFRKKRISDTKNEFLFQTIADCFPLNCTLIPHGKNTAAKRLNLLLRWLVRKNSCVDLGLWTWASSKELLIPLDTHVQKQATILGLLEANKNGKPKAASLKSAVELTKKLSEVFPDDPVRGDFALFGLGANGSIL